MDPRTTRLLSSVAITGVMILTGAIVGRGAAGETDSKRPAQLSSEVRDNVKRTLAEFRSARKDPQKRADVVAEAVDKCPEAVAPLLAIINKELASELKRYRARFSQKAALAEKKKIGKVDLAEVARLRQTVLSLTEKPEFTAEEIVTQADPVMKRLEEIFVLDRADVLKHAPDLQKERSKMLALGGLWEQCSLYLFKQSPSAGDKPAEPPSFENYLQGEESLAVQQTAPMDNLTRAILAANDRLAPQLDLEEVRTILALNLTRNLLGLRALTIDLKLCRAARDHSQDMHDLKFFDHMSPVPGKKTPLDRARLAGTTANGENIVMGPTDGKAANQAWFHSPHHLKNMVRPFQRVGVGRHGVYYTEMFGL